MTDDPVGNLLRVAELELAQRAHRQRQVKQPQPQLWERLAARRRGKPPAAHRYSSEQELSLHDMVQEFRKHQAEDAAHQLELFGRPLEHAPGRAEARLRRRSR